MAAGRTCLDSSAPCWGWPGRPCKEAFSELIADTTLNGRQLQLIDMIVSQLTRGGPMEVAALYDPPFTDLAAGGPEGLFAPKAVDRIGEVIRRFGAPVETPAASAAEQRGQATA